MKRHPMDSAPTGIPILVEDLRFSAEPIKATRRGSTWFSAEVPANFELQPTCWWPLPEKNE